jgi:hypothetical protein
LLLAKQLLEEKRYSSVDDPDYLEDKARILAAEKYFFNNFDGTVAWCNPLSDDEFRTIQSRSSSQSNYSSSKKKKEREIKDAEALKEHINKTCIKYLIPKFYWHRKLEYYQLKVKFHMMFKDIEKSRKCLYKIDLLLRDKFPNDYDKRTDFFIL